MDLKFQSDGFGFGLGFMFIKWIWIWIWILFYMDLDLDSERGYPSLLGIRIFVRKPLIFTKDGDILLII